VQRDDSLARGANRAKLLAAVGRMRHRTLAACFHACAQLLALRRQRDARSSAAMWARALGRDRQADILD
jgi:hypothetical protein